MKIDGNLQRKSLVVSVLVQETSKPRPFIPDEVL
jgi:hypothetical protein